ncbi:MAG: hypothetical protein ACYC0U_02085 [Ilumatobacteraceae bacterium]
MKTSLATTLSVIGVLATGGVALAVNTTVLDSTVSSVHGPSPLAEALVPIAALSVDSTVPVDSTIPVDSTVPITPVSTATPASVQSAYDVQGVGIITLEQNGTGLNIVSVNPVSGWTYNSTNERATRAGIEFTNGTQNVKFTAELLNGRVVTAVEAVNTKVGSSPPNSGGGGGDDEDENENEGEGNDD